MSHPDRRSFLGYSSAAVAALAGGATVSPGVAAAGSLDDRCKTAADLRERVAEQSAAQGCPAHPNNETETDFPNKIANYSKGLPHNQLGEVDLAAYNTLLQALRSGRFADFENIRLGLGRRLTNPQGGLAFELEGLDPAQYVQRPAPRIDEPEGAGEEVELYWMALLRDVSFSDYPTHPLAQAAARDLSRLSDFRGPKIGGAVTPATLFRGNTPGDLAGPYLSQFLIKDFSFGAVPISQHLRTLMPGRDYLTDYASWLAVQNGQDRTGQDVYDTTFRYIRNGRDLGQWVHIDVLYQAYLNAFLVLAGLGAPLNPGNPYVNSRTQIGFGTFGGPHIATVLTEVSTRALHAVWFQKWFVHRRLRPEAYGGLIHNTLTRAASYPVHQEVLRSDAVAQVRARTGTFLLPQAFPEGSPTHPSYGAGHATVAGAAVTVLKAMFDERWVLPDPRQSSADGTTTLPYSGAALTVGGELNKLAANIANGRNIAGVHYRSDASESLRLGEQVAIAILRQQKPTFNEPSQLSFTRFDGSRITI